MVAKRFFYVCAGILLGVTCALRVEAQTLIVPFGSSGWRYIYTNDSVNLADVSRVDFDDSGWPVGCAPFGDGGGGSGCFAACTPWSAAVRIVARKKFQVVGTGSANFDVRFTKGANIWANGAQVTIAGSGDGCRLASGGFALQSGDNVLMVFANAPTPPGGQVDAQIIGYGVTPARLRSWGFVKTHYR
jgi:hypothetical protein